jgi:hypothetical protein
MKLTLLLLNLLQPMADLIAHHKKMKVHRYPFAKHPIFPFD